MLRLFIDPGTTSTGWAVFDRWALVDSGTVAVTAAVRKLEAFDRIAYIRRCYVRLLQTKFRNVTFGECHIERMNRQVHISVCWSVGMFGELMTNHSTKVDQEISPTAWQKYVGWSVDDKTDEVTVTHPIAIQQQKLASSKDQLTAVCMGLYFIAQLDGSNGK